ncbi:MAG: hypothetical protein Q9223_007227, partial [Gallowayella weberi]
MAPYEYIPFDPFREEAKEIRLLTLLPDLFETPIYITIRTVVLSDEEVPEFEALSYAWGDPADRLDIYVKVEPSEQDIPRSIRNLKRAGRKTLSVTRNLAEALKHLRLENRPRVFWIDAICVNQKNLTERSNQVLRMPDIYSSAKGVVAWLGPESDDSPLAMKYLQDLGSRITVDWDHGIFKAASENHIDPSSQEFVDEVKPNRTTDMPTWVPDWSVGSEFNDVSLEGLADGGARAHARSPLKGTFIGSITRPVDFGVGRVGYWVPPNPFRRGLIATGLCVTVIDQRDDNLALQVPRTGYQWAKWFGELISALIGRGIIDSSLDGLPTFCRALCANSFSNKWVPLDQNLPELERAVEYCRDCHE